MGSVRDSGPGAHHTIVRFPRAPRSWPGRPTTGCLRRQVDAGLGQGWLPEEFAGRGRPDDRDAGGLRGAHRRDAGVLGPDPVEYTGSGLRQAALEHRTHAGGRPATGVLGTARSPVLRSNLPRGSPNGFITAVVDWDASGTEIQWYRDAGGRGPVLVRVMGFEPDLTRLGHRRGDAIVALTTAPRRPRADERHFGIRDRLSGLDRWVPALDAVADRLAHGELLPDV